MSHITKQEEKLIRDMRRVRSDLDFEVIFHKLDTIKHTLTPWEMNFIESLRGFLLFSTKQKKVLEDLYARYLEEKKKK